MMMNHTLTYLSVWGIPKSPWIQAGMVVAWIPMGFIGQCEGLDELPCAGGTRSTLSSNPRAHHREVCFTWKSLVVKLMIQFCESQGNEETIRDWGNLCRYFCSRFLFWYVLFFNDRTHVWVSEGQKRWCAMVWNSINHSKNLSDICLLSKLGVYAFSNFVNRFFWILCRSYASFICW